MLSKEEIEKAKEFMKFYKNHCLNIEKKNIEKYGTVNDEEFIYKNIELLLQYIDELEEYLEKISKQLDNVAIDQIPIGIAELQQVNNKQNNDTYWKGYIQKQNEAVEICKMCKYRKQYFERNVKEHE